MIYLLIAGTYTPICLVTLRGGWGWSLFGVVWGLAAIGVLIKLFWMERVPRAMSFALYLLMGWVAIVAVVPIVQAFSPGALGWLAAGGLFYTVGTIFLGLDAVVPRGRWWGMHEVFHLFVVAGSLAHYWLMWEYVLA
jgi:hemolysin III